MAKIPMAKISERDCIDLETILGEKLRKELLDDNSTADHLNFIYEIIDTLRGAYNEEGIRRWFYRKRAHLDWKNPIDYLGRAWDPQEEHAKKVFDLAKTLNY